MAVQDSKTQTLLTLAGFIKEEAQKRGITPEEMRDSVLADYEAAYKVNPKRVLKDLKYGSPSEVHTLAYELIDLLSNQTRETPVPTPGHEFDDPITLHIDGQVPKKLRKAAMDAARARGISYNEALTDIAGAIPAPQDLKWARTLIKTTPANVAAEIPIGETGKTLRCAFEHKSKTLFNMNIHPTEIQKKFWERVTFVFKGVGYTVKPLLDDPYYRALFDTKITGIEEMALKQGYKPSEFFQESVTRLKQSGQDGDTVDGFLVADVIEELKLREAPGFNRNLPVYDTTDLANREKWGKAKATLIKIWAELLQKAPWEQGLTAFELDLSRGKYSFWYGDVGDPTAPHKHSIGKVLVFLEMGKHSLKDVNYHAVRLDSGAFRATIGEDPDNLDLHDPVVLVTQHCEDEIVSAGISTDVDKGNPESVSVLLEFVEPLQCAMLAIIDLMTIEIRRIQSGRPIHKKKNLGKRLPTIEINYKPVIYAPKTKVIYEAPKPQVIAVAPAPQAPDTTPSTPSSTSTNLPKRPVTRHHVAAFKRNQTMSVKHYTHLMKLQEEGARFTDKNGQEIPIPVDRSYTIVLGHERGTVIPEVVSKGVVDFLSHKNRQNTSASQG